MSLWMDMTNSLKIWPGGVVGIVRAELEVAKHLKSISPDIRFSVYDGENFLEVEEKELKWLFEGKNVTEDYLKHFGRDKKVEKEADKETDGKSVADGPPIDLNYIPNLQKARSYSNSRVKRLKHAGVMLIQAMPMVSRPLLYLMWLVAAIPLTIISGVIYVARYIFNKIKNVFYRIKSSVNNFIYKLKHPSRQEPQIYKEWKIEHPFSDGDKIYSMGWIVGGKEVGFSWVKEDCSVCLIYLIYDLILINEQTAYLYHPSDANPDLFKSYYEWTLINCDYLLYGGETTKKDSEKYQQKLDMPFVPGFSVKFGCNVLNLKNDTSIVDVKNKFKIRSNYIIAVGSIEPRKNYITIYRAYVLLIEKYKKASLPQLIIVGANVNSEAVIISSVIESDPKTKELILIIQPTDTELDLLYKNCDFVILPSVYEGWSLTLPEALGYGKFVIACDVPPIKEIGKDLIKYIPTNELENAEEWAETLEFYFNNPDEIKKYERKIISDYLAITWKDCALQVYSLIEKCKINNSSATYWFDISLTLNWMWANHYISGITRTEINLLRHLSHVYKNMKYFAITNEGFFYITKISLNKLIGFRDLEWAYLNSKSDVLSNIYTSKRSKEISASNLRSSPDLKDAVWMICSVLPSGLAKKVITLGKLYRKRFINEAIINEHPIVLPVEKVHNGSLALDVPFDKKDIIFNAGIGGTPSTYASLIDSHRKQRYKWVQLMYDFTPMLVPQTHQEITIKSYIYFTEFVAKMSDMVLYGGATAMRDGENYLRKMNFPIPHGVPIKLGSNFSDRKEPTRSQIKYEEQILKDLDLDPNFIITVGTWEYRKNHLVLYNAYKHLIAEGHKDDVPQLVFVGRPGWKTEHLIYKIMNDTTLKAKIMLRSPSDEQLDALYKNCMFTVLPSIYEGWSLTLPEGLAYRKFCIASNAAPIMETGGDFCEYVHPYDVASWAEKILYYSTHEKELKERERHIAENYKPITWLDCAKQIIKQLENL